MAAAAVRRRADEVRGGKRAGGMSGGELVEGGGYPIAGVAWLKVAAIQS